jgi:hypothetical protein
MDVRNRLVVLRATRFARRAARDRRRRLERELGACTRPGERADLEATFDRYPDGVTAELRDILAASARRATPARQPLRPG